MSERAARRRLARAALAVLLVLHVGTYAGYLLLTRQQDFRTQLLEARDLWRNGDLTAAAALYRRLAESYASATWPIVLVRGLPSRATVWFSLGRVEAERQHVDAGLEAFRQAMALENGLGRREYRDLLFESGRYAALEAYARAELAREPDSIAARLDLGAALYARDRPSEAAAVYESALPLVPAFVRRTDPAFHGPVPGIEASLLNYASLARLAAGDAAGAARDCDRLTAQLSPEARLDRLCRAHLAAAQGAFTAARAALGGYLPRAPEDERILAALEARLAAAGPRG